MLILVFKVNVDPNYIVKLDSIKCLSDSCLENVLKCNCYAIHSPSRLFAESNEKNIIGKYYEFNLSKMKSSSTGNNYYSFSVYINDQIERGN